MRPSDRWMTDYSRFLRSEGHNLQPSWELGLIRRIPRVDWPLRFTIQPAGNLNFPIIPCRYRNFISKNHTHCLSLILSSSSIFCDLRVSISKEPNDLNRTFSLGQLFKLLLLLSLLNWMLRNSLFYPLFWTKTEINKKLRISQFSLDSAP